MSGTSLRKCIWIMLRSARHLRRHSFRQGMGFLMIRSIRTRASFQAMAKISSLHGIASIFRRKFFFGQIRWSLWVQGYMVLCDSRARHHFADLYGCIHTAAEKEQQIIPMRFHGGWAESHPIYSVAEGSPAEGSSAGVRILTLEGNKDCKKTWV